MNLVLSHHSDAALVWIRPIGACVSNPNKWPYYCNHLKNAEAQLLMSCTVRTRYTFTWKLSFRTALLEFLDKSISLHQDKCNTLPKVTSYYLSQRVSYYAYNAIFSDRQTRQDVKVLRRFGNPVPIFGVCWWFGRTKTDNWKWRQS